MVGFFLLKRAPLLTGDLWKDFSGMELNFVFKFFFFIIKWLQTLYKMLTDFDIVYNLGLIFFIVIGIIIHPFFQAFCLSDFLRTEYLKNVIKAIYYPRVELVLSFILFIIIEYYFSLAAYI